jgi:hypothetical protein
MSYELWLTARSLIYSVRKDFTGFAIAALIACTLTVSRAINKVMNLQV